MASTLETTAPPAATPRLPSTRPIDQRWDRSRGIVFNNAKRPIPRDATWSPANGIFFTPFSTTAKHDKWAPLGPARRSNDTAPPPPKAASTPSSKSSTPFNQAYKPGSAPVMSQQLVEGLKQDNTEKAAEIERLEQTVRQNEERLAKMEDEANAHKKRYSALQESARINADKAREEATSSTKSAYESKIRSQEKSHSETLQSLKIEYANKAANLERHFKGQLELHPEYTNIVQDMRKKAQQDEASLLQEKERLVEEQDKSRKSSEELELQKVQNAQEIEQQKQELSQEFAKAEKSWTESRQMLNERAERSQRDRTNYTVYRNLFDEVTDGVLAMLDPFNISGNALQHEADRWRTNARRFQEWKKNEHKLFDHIPRYKALGQAIGEFLENRATQADAARVYALQMRDQLHGSMREVKPAAHVSRALTRLLHFEEEMPLHKATRLAYDVGHSEAYLSRRAKQNAEITQLEATLKKAAGPVEAAKLKQNINYLKDERAMYDGIVITSRSMNELHALETLLDDTTVEQLVYLNTREAEAELNLIIDEYRDILDDYQSTWSEEGRAQVKNYVSKEQGLRRTLDDLTASLRKQFMIELEAGDMDEAKERKKAEAIIKKLMADIAARLSRKLATRKARVAAEKASGSMESLRRSLAQPSTPLKIVSYTARPSVRPPARFGQGTKLAGLKEQVRTREQERVKLLAKVDRDKGEFDEISKMKLSRVERQIKVVRSSLSKLEQTSAGTETTASAEPVENQREVKKGSRRVRLGLRAPGWRVLKLGSDKGARPSPVRSINLTPSKPLQAHYGSHRLSLRSLPRALGPWDRERSLSWETLPDEGQVRSSSSLAVAHAPDEASEEGQVDSPQSDDPNGTSQSSFALSESKTSSASSQGTALQDTIIDAEAGPAMAEIDTLPILTYNMSAKDYRTAATASQSSTAAWWSHKLYKAADGTSPKVFYCTNFETAEKQAKLFLDEPVVGFDLEWEPKSSLGTSPIKRSVSLIQIASEDKIGLFQIALFKGDTAAELMPPTLRKILESPHVIKTGVNVAGDTRRMQTCFDVEMKGVMELSHLYRVVKFSVDQPKLVSFKLVALADQVRDILLLPLKKDDSRMSSWSRLLNGQQTHYAAADAYAGFCLFHAMEKQRKEMTPTPPRPAFFETMKPIILGDGTVIERSAKRTPGAAAGKKTTAEAAEGEEEEEFFDAEEDLDTYELAPSELANSASASTVPPSNTATTQGDTGVAYPTLPQIIESTSTAPDATEQTNQEQPSTAKPAATHPSTSNPAITTAETWLSTLPTPKARLSELRAYHLWHHQTLSLQTVATTLRQPPLAMTTVASYVLQAVKEENLPYDAGRMREALGFLPKSVHGRYKGVVEKVRKWERERGRSD